MPQRSKQWWSKTGHIGFLLHFYLRFISFLFTCLSVHKCVHILQVNTAVRTGPQIPWSWGDRQQGTESHGGWERTLQQQHGLLLITSSSLQPAISHFCSVIITMTNTMNNIENQLPPPQRRFQMHLRERNVQRLSSKLVFFLRTAPCQFQRQN